MTATKTADVSLSSIYAAKAKKLDIDTTRAAKLVRARLRGNFDHVCKLDPRIAKAKSKSNDGNRWPKTVTRSVAEYVLAGDRAAKA